MVLPMTSTVYSSTGQRLGKKLLNLSITPLVYCENLLYYVHDEVAHLFEKRKGGFDNFYMEVLKTCKYNDWSIPLCLIWDEPYFT
jgi:hypothetical protein